PCLQLAKVNLASRRQPILADTPALHLPPIKFRGRKSDRRYIDFVRGFTVKDTDGSASCLPASFLRCDKGTADDPAAEVGVAETENGSVGDATNLWEHNIFFTCRTGCVGQNEGKIDCASLWKCRDAIHHFFKR